VTLKFSKINDGDHFPMHIDIVASLVCLQEELDKHKTTFQPDELRDFMDAYLKELSSNDKKPSFSGTTYVFLSISCKKDRKVSTTHKIPCYTLLQ
jgi:hypothetical protein